MGAMDLWTPTHNLEFAQHLMMSIRDTPFKSPQHYTLFDNQELWKVASVKIIEKIIEVALDIRPKAPMLVKFGIHTSTAVALAPLVNCSLIQMPSCVWSCLEDCWAPIHQNLGNLLKSPA